MRSIYVALALSLSFVAEAQRFRPLADLPLPDSLTTVGHEIADIDNDGLLDVLLFVTDINSSKHLLFSKGDTTSVPALRLNSLALSEYTSYSLLDYDADNDIDMLTYGLKSVVYLNEGNFTFNVKFLDLPNFTLINWLDFDNDGLQEVVGSFVTGSDTLTCIFQRQNEWEWRPVGDTLNLSTISIQPIDVDNNGMMDLFVSGRVNADSVYSGVLINKNDFKFTTLLHRNWIGTSSVGDLNHDGSFDIVFSGLDGEGNAINRLLLSKNKNYLEKDSLLAVQKAIFFPADFNSDGKNDLQFVGQYEGERVNRVQTATAVYETLPAANLVSQHFADLDHDGDLDIVQLTNPDSLHFLFFENTSERNAGPSIPTKAMGIRVYDRYFLYWEPGRDDHTPSISLTYDVLLSPIQMAEFDLLTERRLRVSHGNNGTLNFRLFNNLLETPASFAIQAIDNSFMTKDKGLCVGSGVLDCLGVEQGAMRISVCKDEQVVLSSPDNVLWFSFSEGFMGEQNGASFTAQRADTLFYFDASAPTACAAIKSFIIEINNVPKKQYFEKFACKNEVLDMEVEEGWEKVTWSSLSDGALGSSRTIKYTVTVPDTVYVRLNNDEGCDIIRKTAIKISMPEVKVEQDQFIILKGQQVQLNATGAERYLWTPTDQLSDATIASPLASPLITTNYVVTGYDSVNCTNQASVSVIVEDTGFVPNLFTPNNDDKNDELRIYGLREANEFAFLIYNREGKLVYEAKSVSEITQHGWDGTSNGAKQPAAVYFWKVKGTLPSGEKVRLNGKSEGSLVLVR